jgi:hypothetical protein
MAEGELAQEIHQDGGKVRLLHAYRLLHQDAVHEFVQPAFAVVDVQDVLLRGVARRRLVPDPAVEDRAEVVGQVGHRPAGGRPSRRVRHGC